MLERDVRVTANSDDPSYLHSNYLNEIYLNTQRAGDLSVDQMVQLSRNAFEGAWITPDERNKYIALLEAYVSEHG